MFNLHPDSTAPLPSLQIVETMSLSTDVEELLEALGPFYEYVKEDDSGVEMESPGINALLGTFTGNNVGLAY